MVEERLTKNQRREQAREKARLAREQAAKKDKTKKRLIQGGVVLAVLAIIAIVALVITNAVRPAGPGPANMASGGVVFGKDLKVVESPALQAGEARTSKYTDFGKKPIHVQVYLDFMCPFCGQFEEQNGAMLEQYTGAGDITLEIHPLNFLDPQSGGSKYSTRAANAFACLVDQQPHTAYNFQKAMLSSSVQPSEGGQGLTDEQIYQQALDAGANGTAELQSCIKTRQFAHFIDGNYDAVTQGAGVLGLQKDAQLTLDFKTGEKQKAGEPQKLISTPLVIIDGEEWNSAEDGNLELVILKKLQGAEDAAAEEAPAE